MEQSIYPNSLIFDDPENSNWLSETECCKEQINKNEVQLPENPLQQAEQLQHQNIYTVSDNFNTESFKNQKKGRTLHLLKNFTQEMKQRWNMDEVEMRIHNFLDENQIYVTDPMQKQMDYYQKIKSQVISSVILSNQQSDEEDVYQSKREMEEENQQIQLSENNKSNSNNLEVENEMEYDDHESSFEDSKEERENPQNCGFQKDKSQGTINCLESISTTSSLNSQLSLQFSSILVKRRQNITPAINICQQAPRSLSQQYCYEYFYYN